MEDIYTYVDALQRLGDLARPFIDYHAKEEMVADQFLLVMGNHDQCASGRLWAQTSRGYTQSGSVTGSCPGGGNVPLLRTQTR